MVIFRRTKLHHYPKCLIQQFIVCSRYKESKTSHKTIGKLCNNRRFSKFRIWKKMISYFSNSNNNNNNIINNNNNEIASEAMKQFSDDVNYGQQTVSAPYYYNLQKWHYILYTEWNNVLFPIRHILNTNQVLVRSCHAKQAQLQNAQQCLITLQKIRFRRPLRHRHQQYQCFKILGKFGISIINRIGVFFNN